MGSRKNAINIVPKAQNAQDSGYLVQDIDRRNGDNQNARGIGYNSCDARDEQAGNNFLAGCLAIAEV